MLRVDVQVEDIQWKPFKDLFKKTIPVLLNDALTLSPAHHKGRVSILLASNDAVQLLNKQFRGLDKPTNVLSFPPAPFATRPRQSHHFGDIILAFETLQAEAEAQHKTLTHHITHLVLHGFLHLLGFDHEEED